MYEVFRQKLRMAYSPEPFRQLAEVENFMVCKILDTNFNFHDIWRVRPLMYHSNSFMTFILPLTGYDGPLQYTMTPGNPDSVISLQSNNVSHEEGKYVNIVYFELDVPGFSH
jgi:hypothetical protein